MGEGGRFNGWFRDSGIWCSPCDRYIAERGPDGWFVTRTAFPFPDEETYRQTGPFKTLKAARESTRERPRSPLDGVMLGARREGR